MQNLFPIVLIFLFLIFLLFIHDHSTIFVLVFSLDYDNSTDVHCFGGNVVASTV